MITHLDDHTIKLSPDAPQKCSSAPRKNAENWLGREVRQVIRKEVRSQIKMRLWFERQLRRSDEYVAALEAAVCSKSDGLPYEVII